MRRDLRGGDQWGRSRAHTATARAAAVVAAVGVATAADVVAATGLSWNAAHLALRACLRRPHLYHIVRIARGRYTVREAVVSVIPEVSTTPGLTEAA